MVLRLGRIRFGEPDAEIAATIESIDDLGRVEHLAERILMASGWDDLVTQA